MSDISMCAGINCDSKDKCYRFTAHVGERQSYSSFYTNVENGKCMHFWANDYSIESENNPHSSR